VGEIFGFQETFKFLTRNVGFRKSFVESNTHFCKKSVFFVFAKIFAKMRQKSWFRLATHSLQGAEEKISIYKANMTFSKFLTF
jgi:hypothetical protein